MPQLSAYPEHADRIAAKLKEVQDMKLDQFFAFADGPEDQAAGPPLSPAGRATGEVVGGA